MATCTVPGVFSKPETDKTLFKIDWSSQMQLGIGRTIPIVDKIASSGWAIDADSPQATITTPDEGFDETSATTWVAVDGGNDGDVIYLNNTITTTGSSVNGKVTPAQRFTRQLRIRIDSC